MITYYIYGRRDGVGYISHNPVYSAEDADQYFSKMAGYIPIRNEEGREIRGEGAPEKYFLYNMDSSKHEPVLVWGKSVQAAPNEFSDPNRYSDFSHQYILNGEERKDALENVADLLDSRNFYCELREIYEVENSVGNAVEFKSKLPNELQLHKQTDVESYSLRELLAAFDLNKQKVRELLYSMLCFNRGRRIYIELPENSKRGTDLALALMKKMLLVIPVQILERLGFVTYVSSVSDDYISAETEIVFLSKTVKNQVELKKNGMAYCFTALTKNTNVEIPAQLAPLIDSVEEAFMTGAFSENLRRFYGLLKKYLQEDSRDSISDAEYEGLWNFGIQYANLVAYIGGTGIKASLPEKEIWGNIDLLHLMIQKRSFLWSEELDEDVLEFEKAYIRSGLVEKNQKNFSRLFFEYQKDIRLEDTLVDFFSSCIHTAKDLSQYMEILLACEPLRKSVSERIIVLIENFLQSGDLDPSLYNLVINYYGSGDLDSELVESFFTSKCTNMETLNEIKETLMSQRDKKGGQIWKAVKRNIYQNPNMYEVAVLREKQKLTAAYRDSMNKGGAFQCNAIWDILLIARDFNSLIPKEEIIKETVVELIFKVLVTNNTIKDAKAALQECEKRASQMDLLKQYEKSFTEISETYLKKFSDEICEECENTRILENWPVLDRENSTLRKIREKIECRENELRIKEEFAAGVSGNAGSIYLYLKRQLGNETLKSWIKDKSFWEEQIRSILVRITKETSGKKRRVENEKLFDNIHMQLIFLFPKNMPLILSNVMKSPQGGILGMRALYNCILSTSGHNLYLDSSTLEKSMKETVLAYFRDYKMSKQDVRDVKACQNFLLRDLGLSKIEYRNLKK